MTLGHNDSTINIVMAIIIIIVVVVVVTVAPAQLYPSRIIILTLRPRSMRNSVCVTNGRAPVIRPSVCPVDRQQRRLLPIALWAGIVDR